MIHQITYLLLSETDRPLWEVITDNGVAIGIVIIFAAGAIVWFNRHKLEEWREERLHKQEQRAEERRHRQKLNDLEIQQREVYIEREKKLTSHLEKNSDQMATMSRDQKDMLAVLVRTSKKTDEIGEKTDEIGDRLKVVEEKIFETAKTAMDSCEFDLDEDIE